MSEAPRSPYNASAQGRRLRLMRSSITGPNVAQGGANTIIGRSRDAARNDPWIGTAADKRVSNGIGTGIQTRQKWGSKKFRKAVDALWAESMRELDADGVLHWYAMQSLAWREWDEAGECFLRFRSRRTEDGLAVPLQVQLIESEQCPRDYYATAPNGNRIRCGVEFSRIGKRMAYWMYREHPGEERQEVNATELVRVPADQILHLFEPLRAGQIRGLPRGQSVLIRAHGLDRLDDATMERKAIANLFGGWYVRKNATPGAGEVGPRMHDDMAPDDGSPKKDEDDTPLSSLEPGTWQELPEGMEVQFSNPPGAGDDYSDYLRAQLMAIAARWGIPLEVLTGDLRDISDRALKLILAEFQRTIEMHQWLNMIPQICQPVREAWFDAAVLAGKIKVADYAKNRSKVIDALHVPQGWKYSHPVQDVDAHIKAVRAGFNSQTNVILSYGEDPEEISEQQKADNERAFEYGLMHDSDGRRARNGSPNKQDQNE